jgi:hypothetical protein
MMEVRRGASGAYSVTTEQYGFSFMPPGQFEIELYITDGKTMPYVWHGMIPLVDPKSFAIGWLLGHGQ